MIGKYTFPIFIESAPGNAHALTCGGIASLGSGLLPAEMIIPEHYRLGSNCAILSRAFCDVSKVGDIDEIRRIFNEGVSAIRDYEKKCAAMSEQELSENSAALKQRVEEIVSNMQ